MAVSNIHVVIMAGGTGTRIWPISTPQNPKQFLFLTDTKKSLLQLTFERVRSLTNKNNIWVVSSSAFKKTLYNQLPKLPKSRFLLEPFRRNTAPCIGWAAMKIYQKNPNAVMVVVPADQWVNNCKGFIQDIKRAISHVTSHPTSLVTFGTRPTRPETGYGYLEMDARPSFQPKMARVRRFVEKPDLATAKKMCLAKNFFWNSGMFVWKVGTILHEIKQHLPSLYRGLMQLHSRRLKSLYQRFAVISIDYGVMEKSKNVHMVRAAFESEDLGNWENISRKRGNRVKQWISIDSKDCFIDAPSKKVATIGVSNLVIVETQDSLLICDKSKTQDVRKIVENLK